MGTAQIAGKGDIQGSIAVSDQILGGSQTQLVIACCTPANSLLVNIGNSQSAIPLVAVRYPIQQLKAGCARLIHVEAEHLMVGGYIIIPGPAAAYATVYGIHGTTPAPQHGTGVIALGNIIGVHLPSALTGIVTDHIFLKPGGRRGHTKVIATGLQHIVAILNGKVAVGTTLCPVQGFSTLVSSGVRYCHRACIEVQTVPGIAIMELVQVNTNIHIGSCIEGCPVTIPLTAVGIVGIVIRSSLCIDSKYQVGISFCPQSLQIVSLQAGIGGNGQGIGSLSTAIAPAICKQQLINHRNRAIIFVNVLLSSNTVQIHCLH